MKHDGHVGKVPLLTSLIFLCAVGAITFALYERKVTLDQTDQRICLALENLNREITMSLKRSRDSIPKLSYYRRHPEEMQRQLVQIDDQIHLFRPRECVAR